MDADVIRDDELCPRQPDSLVRNRRQIEGPTRIADDQHHLRVGLGDGGRVDAIDRIRNAPGIHVPLGSFRAAHGHLIAVTQPGSRVFGADNAGQSKFARDDGSVRGAASFVGHDGRHTPHDGFPVRIGHLGHEHLTSLNRLERLDVPDHTHPPDADALTDGLSPHERCPGYRGQAVDVGGCGPRFRGMDGLRSRLDDHEIAGEAVLCPLDVHRLRVARELGVVHFDEARPARQREHILVIQAVPSALLSRRWLASRTFAAVRVDETHFLRAEPTADDGAMSGRERWFEHGPFIGRHDALDNELPEAIRAGHRDHIAKARFGVEREDHTRTGLVGAHHRHDAD